MTLDGRLERADALTAEVLADRIDYIDEIPGLREAIAENIAESIDVISERFGQQIGQLRSPSSKRIPSAYFADEEAAEEELQKAAAGVRTALALGGSLSVDPKSLEQSIAQSLSSTGVWSLRDEASRVPRPSTRAAVLDWSLAAVPWVNDEAKWPPSEAVALGGVRTLGGPMDPIRVMEAPYTGWVQIGFLERQRTLTSTHPPVPSRQVLIAYGLELGSGVSAGNLPLSSCPPDLWVRPYGELAPGLNPDRAERALGSAAGPIAALVDFDGLPINPERQNGPGLHPFFISPRIELVALLGLCPEVPAIRHVLVDENGPAVVCRQWHGFLIHEGSYGDLVPAVQGSDLILRDDLFDRAMTAIGSNRLSAGLTVSTFP